LALQNQRFGRTATCTDDANTFGAIMTIKDKLLGGLPGFGAARLVLKFATVTVSSVPSKAVG